MAKLAKSIEQLSGVKIRLIGFDTGTGIPQIKDYREHPGNIMKVIFC